MLSNVWQLLVVLGLLIAVKIAKRARGNAESIFRRYAGEMAACGMSGQAVARRLLDALGLSQVAVVRTRRLFSHYRPWRRQVCLNGTAFDARSLPAVVVAAHEVGHAQQFAVGCWPTRVYRVLCPLLCLLVVALITMPLSSLAFELAGSAPSFGLAPPWFALPLAIVLVVLQGLDNLLLEYDATRRAKEIAEKTEVIAPGEKLGFDLMLHAALRTHLGRAGGLAATLLVAGVFLLLNVRESHVGLPEFVAAPQTATPPAAPRPEVMPELPPEVLDLEPDLVTPLLQGGAIAALFALWPVCRWITKILAVKHCRAALALHDQGQWEAAAARFGKALRFDRKQVAAYVGRSTAWLRLGRLGEALADVETALRLAPGVAALLTLRGVIHLSRYDFDHALADLDEALRLVPGSNQALVARGRLWLARQDFTRAAADVEQALAGNPNDLEALRTRCQLHYARNDLDGAAADTERLMALGGGDADSFAWRGNIRAARNQFDLALADLDEAVRRAPQRSDLWIGRGLVRIWAGDFAGAIFDASQAIRLNPQDAVAFNNRGVALLKSGNYAQAAVDLREAIRLQPALPNPHRHLAWLQSTCPLPELRNGSEAVANATRALELAEWKPVDWLATLAAAHAETGDFAGARHWQTKCLEESPPEAESELRARLELYESAEPFHEAIVENLGQTAALHPAATAT